MEEWLKSSNAMGREWNINDTYWSANSYYRREKLDRTVKLTCDTSTMLFVMEQVVSKSLIAFPLFVLIRRSYTS
jgi:hypothetical protein